MGDTLTGAAAGRKAVAPSLGERIEFALFRAAGAGLRWYPAGGPLGAGSLGGRLLFLLDGRHRRVALANVERVYPQLDAARRRHLVRSCFVNFTTSLADALKSSRSHRDAYLARFEVDGWEHLERADAAGRGTLLLSGHLGAWEAAGQLMAMRGKPISFLARPIDNPLVEGQVRAIRERFGNRSIPKRGGGRQMLRTLHSGERLAILLDQRVHPREGRAYEFLGHDAYTSPLLARLSLKTGSPVVPFFGLPLQGWRRYRVEFWPAIWPDGGDGEAIDSLTRRYLAVLEEAIRGHPELWLWMHRRWRKNPPRRPASRRS